VQNAAREGILYGLVAYLWWGLVPIYFRWLGTVPPLDILAHRIVWSAVFLALILTVSRRWPETIRCLATPRLLIPLTVSAILVAVNWLMYILGVHYQMIVQASLGYFILPLVSVTLGVVIFSERLRRLQQLAIAFAIAGVTLLTWESGEFPWLALGLALSFSVYGLIRKQVPVDGLVGLAVETIVLLPAALAFLAFGSERGELEDSTLVFRLSLSGVVTAVPLLCFGQAARRLPLSTLGFMQYVAPSVQFLLAIFLFREEVRGGWFNYGFIWTALVIFTIDSFRVYRQQMEIAEVKQSIDQA
jgi:chloramphenicol-sensitive protein RarD